MEAAPKHSVSVAGIVVDDAERILIIRRRDNGHWEPPGGILELDESFEDGVSREVFEETGLHVHVDRLTGVYKNIRIGVVALVFRCTPLSVGIQTQSHEAETIRWVNLADIPNLMAPAFAIRVTDAFDDYTQTRLHDGVQLIS
jgi:ADP-ribose pyrophosphatase YjhB (NUDIX family)